MLITARLMKKFMGKKPLQNAKSDFKGLNAGGKRSGRNTSMSLQSMPRSLPSNLLAKDYHRETHKQHIPPV